MSKYPDHPLRLWNPEITDKQIDEYYKRTTEALDAIRVKRILAESRNNHIVLD